MNNKIFFYVAVTGFFYWIQTQTNGFIAFLGFAVAVFFYEAVRNEKKEVAPSSIVYLDSLFFKSPSMIVKVDTSTWSIVTINEVLALTLNLAHAYQMIGKPIFSLFAKKDDKTLKRALHELKRKKELHQCAVEILTMDGDKIHVTVDGVMSAKDTEQHMAFLYITNISGIKRIEANLAANRNLLQNIIDNTLEAVIITNKSGKIIEWNPQAEQLLGQCKINVINKSISQVIRGGEDKQLGLERDINSYLSHQPTQFIGKRGSFIIFNKANKAIPVASCCFPVLSDSNYVFCFFLHDISEAKRNEARINDLMSELESSNNELQSFAYIASHDLQEPLRGIKNYADILKEDYTQVLDADGVNLLDLLLGSCKRLELLLQSLLHYSKVGNLQLELKEQDPNRCISDVQDTIHHMLKQKNARIHVMEVLPKVMADESRLQEIFTNLITNGLKYNDKPNPEITIGFSKEKSTESHCCLYVKDNGIGIAQDKIDTVFQIFQRLHRKEEYGGGSGAGLTITKRIVERHKGIIWLESTVGEGTTFYFTLLRG